MSRYGFISSAFRNRILFPNPADFVVDVGTLGLSIPESNVFTTKNPISYSIPDYNFCWTNFLSPNLFVFSTTIISGTSSYPIVDSNVNEILLSVTGEVPGFRQDLQNCFGILKNMILKAKINAQWYERIIIDYDPILQQVTLNNPLPFFSLASGPIETEIVNPSFIKLDGTQIIVINGDFPFKSSNIYLNFDIFLYDLNLNEIRKVFIDDLTNLSVLRLDVPFSLDRWKVTDQYWLISRTSPLSLGRFLTFGIEKNVVVRIPVDLSIVSGGNGYSFQESVTLGNTGLVYQVTQIQREGAVLSLELIHIQDDFQDSSLNINDVYELVPVIGPPKLQPCRVKIVLLQSTIVCEMQNSEVPFQGNYLMSTLFSKQFSATTLDIAPNVTIPPMNSLNIPIDLLQSQNEVGCSGIRDVKRLGTSNVFLITLQQITNIMRLFRLIQIQQPWQIEVFLHFIVVPFSFEGVVPLNLISSTVTLSQMVCYEMSITSLILPNKNLRSAEGLLPSAFPFVFLEISNHTLPSGHQKSIIYSNNPNSVTSTFICSISDISNPDTSQFIKISSDSGKQILKFSPYDSLRIRVALPDGSTFETEEADFFVPNESNHRIQIQVVFEMIRLS
jgi:hypothetical protein